MTLPVADAYAIEIAPLGPDHFNWLAARNYPGWVVIVDANTRQHCWPRLAPFLEGHPHVLIEVPAGEVSKNLDTCQHVWREMFRAGVTRRWCCLNLGGGVVTDMGGFCASTFKRGMDFVQIPTTLLSQVDASVGGKLGIDFFDVKNSIGVFADPRAVWVDTAFLRTLPPREVRSGFAEIIKHALIASPEQWAEVRAIDPSDHAWDDLLARSVDIKRRVVLEDPYERGLRKSLNFGHTIGHAIESYFLDTDDHLLHGEAIAAGMIAESWLSVRLAGLPETDLRNITDYLLRTYGHQPIPPAAFPELLATMGQDKKNEDHRINFTVLEAAGRARVNATASPELITEAITWYNSLRG